MTRPHGRLTGFDALRAELVRFHTDPHAAAFGDGPLGLPGTRGSLGNVIPLRPELELPGPAPAPAGEHAPAPVAAPEVLPGVAPDVAAEAEADELAQLPEADRAYVVDLVARAQAGDGEAFGLLYDRYLDLVYRYVYYRVGAKPLAEDLVSETFLRALRRIGSFEWQGRDFAAWLITIARNIVADHYKSGRFRLEVSTADMLDADRATDGPENEVLEGITNVTLLEAVKKLNGEQQECVVLRFLQGMSVLETAQAMGKSEGAIKALQYRAVRTLGRMLPKELVL